MVVHFALVQQYRFKANLVAFVELSYFSETLYGAKNELTNAFKVPMAVDIVFRGRYFLALYV